VKRYLVFALAIFFATITTSYAGLQRDCSPQSLSADRILVLKGDRKLILLRNGKPIKEYNIALGRHPIGRKVRRGDGRTPEGIYRIDRRNIRSRYHMALHISYPNRDDIAQARARGVPPGRMIMIHGLGDTLGFLGKYHTEVDWTAGCIAVTNQEIEEIWKAVPNGVPVEIRK
jgi:murein L,D-transpeptidase YafK